MPAGSPTAGSQFRPLFDTFLARFFENEVTAGRTDLRHSFFWIIAVLAGPSLLGVVYRQFAWSDIVMRRGADALAAYVLFDKSLYLAVTFVAIGFVSAVAWPSLTIDRRDGLILGALPVRLRSIVAAKLAALGAYIVILSAGMHGLTALLIGGVLNAGVSLDAVVRGIAAHLIAATALAVFVFATAAGAQATSLALLGPKLFTRVSAALQVLLVGVTTASLIALPTVAGGAPGTLAGVGRFRASWIVYTPPIWFLGLYETLSGSTLPVMHSLALVGDRRARRHARDHAHRVPDRVPSRAAGHGSGQSRAGAGLAASSDRDAAVGALPGAGHAGGDSVRPGDVQSRKPAASRGERGPRPGARRDHADRARVDGPAHRPAVETAHPGGGRGAAPPHRLFRDRAPRRSGGAGRAPGAVGLCRGAVAMGDGPGRAAPHHAGGWRAADRGHLGGVLVDAASAPDLRSSTPSSPRLPGLILVEIHSWGVVAIPCTRALDPGAVNLQARWPAYVVGLILFCGELPQAEIALSGTPFGLLTMMAGMTALWLALRRGSRAAAHVTTATEGRDPLLLLDLSPPPPRRNELRP